MEMVSTAVTTAPRPSADYLPETLRQLASAGFPRPLIVAEPGSPVSDAIVNPERLGPCGNFRRALSELLRTDSEWLAVFQDDIEVSRGLFPWVLNDIPRFNKCGVVSLYTPQPQASDEHGWKCVDGISPKTPVGALAILMRHKIARMYIAKPEPSGINRPTTVSLAEFCQVSGLDWYVHNPSFVRHTGEVSAIDMRRNLPPIITLQRQCKDFCEDVSVL